MPRWGGRWSPSVSDQYPWLLHTLASRSSVKSVSQFLSQSIGPPVTYFGPARNPDHHTITVQHHMFLRRRLSGCHNFLPVTGLREKAHT